VKEKGLFDFYESGHGECCGQCAKMRRYAGKLAGVMRGSQGSGKDQEPRPPAAMYRVIEIDGGFSGPAVSLGSSPPWPTTPAKISGTTSACWKYRYNSPARTEVLSALDVSPVPALSCLISMSARVVGGGRRQRQKRMWPHAGNTLDRQG